MPLGVPIVVHPDGSVSVVPPPGPGEARKVADTIAKVVFSRPMRPYEIALALALFKALEKAFGFHLGY